MKVLIVEDDPMIRRVIIGVLRRMCDKLDPWAAESVDEAIGHLRESYLFEKPFDLVISDYNLLGTRKGGEVLEWIREHASYLVPRFIFLTSDDAARGLHERFLEKPCDATTLRKMIESTLATPA